MTGWHSSKGSSSSSTDPALLAVLEDIATKLGALQSLPAINDSLQGMIVAIENLEIVVSDGTTLPDALIADETGAYLVSESGAYLVYETAATLVSESGAILVSESGAQLEAEVPA